MTKDKTNIEEIKRLILREFDERYTVEFSTDYKQMRFWLEKVLFFVLDFEYLIPKDQVQAKKAHRTEEDYCCACSYDMAVMQEKIDKKCEKYLDEFAKFVDERVSTGPENEFWMRFELMEFKNFKKEQREHE